MSFSTIIFSNGIKLFIRHAVVLFGILILSEQFDGFMQLPPWCIRKYRQLCLHKYVEILSSISHYRIGKTNQDTRYDID